MRQKTPAGPLGVAGVVYGVVWESVVEMPLVCGGHAGMIAALGV